MRDVPVSAMAWQPPSQKAVPPTLILLKINGSNNCLIIMFIQPKERSSVTLFLSSKFIGETSGYEIFTFT